MKDIDAITSDAIECAIRIHCDLGPGSLERKGYKIDRQRPIDIEFDGMRFPNAFRIDLMVDDRLVNNHRPAH